MLLKNNKRLVIFSIFSFALVFLLARPGFSFWGQSETVISPHLLLGNPSGATKSLKNPDNYLMVKPQFVLSYNQQKSIPNWVSWQLNKSWLGKYKRCKSQSNKDRFMLDSDLPVAISGVLPTDYRGSGFDRGHMIPSGDRTASGEDNCATFVMTNIIPQTRDINRGPWETLENYSRKLAKNGQELYIIAGGVGVGGESAKGEVIKSLAGFDSGLKINVPALCWKIILVLEQPSLGLKGITPESRVIAVAMKQQMGTRDLYWDDHDQDGSLRYITSVKEIERLTGYNFLSNLPKSLQDVLENKIDSGSQ